MPHTHSWQQQGWWLNKKFNRVTPRIVCKHCKEALAQPNRHADIIVHVELVEQSKGAEP